MENEFRKIVASSSMMRSSYLSGHSHEIARPCMVHGLFNDRTGTLLLEAVYCDGDMFNIKSFTSEEWQEFYDALVQHLVEEDF